MGQKIMPTGFRMGVVVDGKPLERWRSRWYADRKNFSKFLLEDQTIRNYIKRDYGFAAIPRIEVERTREQVTVIVHTARPGVLIGRKGAKIEALKSALEMITERPVDLKVVEVQRPELEAQLLAEGIAEQLQKRSAFRRTIKRFAQQTMQMGAKGVRIQVSGRLGGAEMSRREWSGMGSVPLQTLRRFVDYGFAEAFCTYGKIGVKVWVNRGDYLELRAEASTRRNQR